MSSHSLPSRAPSSLLACPLLLSSITSRQLGVSGIIPWREACKGRRPAEGRRQVTEAAWAERGLGRPHELLGAVWTRSGLSLRIDIWLFWNSSPITVTYSILLLE